MNLNSPIEELPRLTAPIARSLRKLEIKTVRDLLFYFPYRYEDFSKIRNIIDVRRDEQVSIKGVINQIKPIFGFGAHRSRAEAIISDDTGSIKIVWFNQYYLATTLKKGDEIFISGTPRFYKNLQFQNPIYEKINSDGSEQIHTGRILPIYRLGGVLSLRALRTVIFQALDALREVTEYLPANIVAEAGLPDIRSTIKNLHFPETQEALDQARARMAFEEIFYVQLAVEQHKLSIKKQKAPQIKFNRNLVTTFLSSLPFELTPGQKASLWEILQDFEKPQPMNRLLQGEVGSGKTLVAFSAALEVLQKEMQVALLCPTEILAQQHYANALKYFESYPLASIILLTSTQAQLNGVSVGKDNILEEIAHGGPQLIISTHALLQKNVVFKNLAFIVIDEQHRFGVRQRAALKQHQSKIHPHLLSMTATPIPRTLKLSLFGDLEISEIRTLPVGRKPIITKLVEEKDRPAAYDFILKQIQSGRQVFVVTPLIEENDRLGVKSATLEQKNLEDTFSGVKVGLLHGKMKPPEKEKAMADFLAGDCKILVSTSVIEVGVDVPNAAVMVIEGADRFGLAQLHQFRGRVGRSQHQSYCFLFTENQNPKTLERLEEFTKTLNGFELAELDLQNRGFGNIFGEEQSGFYYFKYFSFGSDGVKMAELARRLAQKILNLDPALRKNPYLHQQIEGKVIHLE